MYPGKDDLNEALHLLSVGQKDEARRRLRDIVKRRPSFLQAWKVLADNAENPRERAESIKRAQLLAPGDSWVVEAKKHRMPPRDAQFANPLGPPPEALNASTDLTIPGGHAAVTAPSGTSAVTEQHVSEPTLVRAVRPAPPEEPPVVSADDSTIERPLSADERARFLGERVPAPPPSAPPPSAPKGGSTARPSAKMAEPSDMASEPPLTITDTGSIVPPPTPPSSQRRRTEDRTDEYRLPPAPPKGPNDPATMPYLQRAAIDNALDKAEPPKAISAPDEVEPDELPTPDLPDESGISTRSTPLSALDAYSQRLAEDEPPKVARQQFAPPPEDFDAEAVVNELDTDYSAATIVTKPVRREDIEFEGEAEEYDPAQENASESPALEPWMIIAVAGLAVLGCLLLVAAFASTLVG